MDFLWLNSSWTSFLAISSSFEERLLRRRAKDIHVRVSSSGNLQIIQLNRHGLYTNFFSLVSNIIQGNPTINILDKNLRNNESNDLTLIFSTYQYSSGGSGLKEPCFNVTPYIFFFKVGESVFGYNKLGIFKPQWRRRKRKEGKYYCPSNFYLKC